MYIEEIEALQPHLRACAYNIIGSYEDARDIVQDVLLKQWQQSDKQPDNPRAYLIRMVVNHAINFKKRQQRLVHEYTGPWLPEPVATEQTDQSIQQEEILHYSLLVLMEYLKPKERAVLILKEAFHYSHEEIAALLDMTPAHSRKLLSRGRKALEGRSGSMEMIDTLSSPVQEFMNVIKKGETEKLARMLKEDITLTSDGGGKVIASRRPITGREHVMKFLLGLYKKYHQDIETLPATINHQPALLYYAEQQLTSCQVFEMHEGVI
jgi:RNA polymerase sigma factor (sigma-70 family)